MTFYFFTQFLTPEAKNIFKFSTRAKFVRKRYSTDSKNLWVSGNHSVDLTNAKNCLISEYLRKNTEKFGWGDRVAFESAENGRKYTFSQVLQDARAFAAGLLKIGQKFNLQQKDIVAVILPNMPEYPSVVFGIWEAGLIASLFNPNGTDYEMSHQVEATKSKILVTSPKTLPIARSMKQQHATISKIIVVGNDPNDVPEDCVNYFELLKTSTKGVKFFAGSESTTDNDVALILFSSGTAALPKGVMLTHFSVLSNAILLLQTPNGPSYDDAGTPKRLIGTLPFFHAFALTCTLVLSMIEGMHVTTMSAFVPTVFIPLLQQFKPTVLYVVPTIISFLTNAESIDQSHLESVRIFVCGSTAAGEVLIKRLLLKAKNATFHEVYGLTEASPVLAVTRLRGKIGSIGHPLPEVTMKIVDVTTGSTLSPKQQGELCAKTPSVMKGYMNDEQATKAIIDKDGWVHTGDIGYYDAEGCFYIVDRLKELIKVKSFQVSPSELEDLIRSHEKVADVAVIGIPHEKFGEVPRAYVVVKKDQVVTEEDIKYFVKSKVSSYKHLVGGVEFVKDIPKGGSGKILRRVLRDKYVKSVSTP